MSRMYFTSLCKSRINPVNGVYSVSLHNIIRDSVLALSVLMLKVVLKYSHFISDGSPLVVRTVGSALGFSNALVLKSQKPDSAGLLEVCLVLAFPPSSHNTNTVSPCVSGSCAAVGLRNRIHSKQWGGATAASGLCLTETGRCCSHWHLDMHMQENGDFLLCVVGVGKLNISHSWDLKN